ncbi:class I adenylate-forming enzyme family protein [Sphingomonas adhaesiva]|uniref:class I adenylate-forming enzyme family protein n=1 Tax=Sphingomonas adhaesiva TaxID=28212 RepID=UPI002FF69A4A
MRTGDCTLDACDAGEAVMERACPEAPAEFRDTLAMFRACVDEAPSRTAVAYFDTALTYAQTDRASDRVAVWLIDHGVVRGDRVAIILQNMPQSLMALVAAWKIGAIPVPGNPAYRAAELSRVFADCAPRAIVCLAENVETVRIAGGMAGIAPAILVASARGLQQRHDARVIPAAEPTPDLPQLERIIAAPASPAVPDVALDGDEIGLILYTSGTTGEPKGAMIRHRSLAFNGQSMRDLCGLSGSSRILGIAPLFHITGMSCHVAAALSARATLVLHYRVEPTLLLDVIREHRPTFTIGAITAFNALMNVPGIGAEDMRGFDRIYSGGAPVPPALLEELARRLGVRIHTAYGMTETTAQTHIAPFGATIPVDPQSGSLSIGKLTPLTAARIVDGEGRDVADGEQGELLIRGPQIMAGYWNKPAGTNAALADGWMHTGDVAVRDADGWYYLVDRIKDCIIASGFKVWPREVEDALYTHGAVREAAVVGVPDPYRGETVKAFISLRPGAAATPDDLIAHSRTLLAAYKVPRVVEIMDELPKTVTGKIQRHVLRESERSQV